MSVHARPRAPDVREEILNAARARFLHFGYHKTTMAEIAEDAGMSAANLYRYFDNKLDIAAGCATQTLNERFERLRLIAERSDRDAGQRLTDYALGIIEHSHDLARPDSRIGEFVDTITREYPDLVAEKMATHHALIAGIIASGVAAGEFAARDVEETARYVYSALVVFDVPLFIGILTREEFEARARGVVALLLDGLRRSA